MSSKKMKISLYLFFLLLAPSVYAQPVPQWVTNLERAYPSKDWIAVNGQGSTQTQAETNAMQALARAFKINISSLTQATQRYSEIVNSGNPTLEESKNYLQEVNTAANVQGLIGVQMQTYKAKDNTVYVNARMNRKECALRYTTMIQLNSSIINNQLSSAAATPQQDTFGIYKKLGFAHALAQATDNFQHILEVLDPTAVNRKPNYGGANAIKAKMLETASRITIGITLNTEQQADKTLLIRAAGSFFRDLGFKTDEQGQGNYTLRANVRFESVQQSVLSCRYYLDASLIGANGVSIFSFTEDDRKAHYDNASEARRLAVRAVETSFKEGKFAVEFNAWLNSLVEN